MLSGGLRGGDGGASSVAATAGSGNGAPVPVERSVSEGNGGAPRAGGIGGFLNGLRSSLTDLLGGGRSAAAASADNGAGAVADATDSTEDSDNGAASAGAGAEAGEAAAVPEVVEEPVAVALNDIEREIQRQMVEDPARTELDLSETEIHELNVHDFNKVFENLPDGIKTLKLGNVSLKVELTFGANKLTSIRFGQIFPGANFKLSGELKYLETLIFSKIPFSSTFTLEANLPELKSFYPENTIYRLPDPIRSKLE